MFGKILFPKEIWNRLIVSIGAVGSVSDQTRIKTKCPLKIEWEGEMYELEFETRDLSTFSGGDYFKGLKDDDEMKESRNIIHDLTEKSTEKTRRKCKTKKNKPINVGGSEWWRKPRILSQTNTKKRKEIFESTENEEISFKHKRRDRWSTRSWNGEYREFTKLASSTQDRVFRDSFLPCVDEHFGSFEGFMKLLIRTNKFRRWARPRIRFIQRETVQKVAKKFEEQGVTSREENFSSLLLGKLSLSEWNRNRSWTKKIYKTTGKIHISSVIF